MKIKPQRKDKEDKAMGEWKHINWRKLERSVFKLQKSIYKASLRGDVKAIRRLQKTLMKSWRARCLSVRRVTQDNAGKVRHEVVQKTHYSVMTEEPSPPGNPFSLFLRKRVTDSAYTKSK